jgi:predicted permease
MDTWMQNLRLAARQLRRSPGFTVTVVATLALAIGANTAIFSIVNALLLKPLPYPEPSRIGTIFLHAAGADTEEGGHWIDGTQWENLRDHAPSLVAAVSGAMFNGVNLQADGRAQYVHDARVSAHYLDVLGLHPMLGRNFTADEDLPNGPQAAILGYDLWKNTFGADRALIGQVIHLKGEPYTVVGVLPRGAVTPINADLYTPLKPSRHGEGGGTNYSVLVRLKDGATWQQADAEINQAWSEQARHFAKQYPAGTQVSFNAVPLQQGQAAELRPRALALMMAAGFILLIACANLAGLTLVRMARRTQEIATRLALGGSRWQVQRQLWLENLLLAAAGGLSGIAVGYAALRGLLHLLPEDYLPVSGVSLDFAVFAFTLAVAALTSVFFGMLPALAVRRVDLRSSMASRSVAGGERLRLRQSLIALEVALTVVLLAGSGLLIRTLVHLETLPPGFNPNGVMAAKASLDDARFHDPAAFRQLLDRSTAAMAKLPGVDSAAVALSLPYERGLNDAVTFNDGPNIGKQDMTGEAYITPDYFRTLQMPLLAGRAFTAADGPAAQKVAIVNQTFARKFFPGQSPVGHTVNKGMLIVGVVGDVKVQPSLNPGAPIDSEEFLYFPAAQMDNAEMLAMVHTWFQPSWIIRTSHNVDGLTGQMQQALSSVAPGLPFSGFYRMADLEAKTLATQRIEVALLGVMAGLALLLSAVGIFALVANMVAQRTREIGIRLALGSPIGSAMANVARSGVIASALGLVAGLGLCAAVLRVLRTVLYGIGAYDAATLSAVVLTLALITTLAATIPVLRIARIDPARTLRDE